MIFNRALVAFLTTACLTFQSLPATAAVLMDLYNTGVDDAGVPLAGGVNDSHYSVVRVSSPLTGITDVVAPPGYPIPPWVANDSNSKWIGVSTNGTSLATAIDPSPGPNGVYHWTTTFDVPGNADLSSISIIGRWATDNPGTDILINGMSTGNTASGYTAYSPFSILSGFVTGINTLTFIVENLAYTGPGGNPSGLRVDDMVGTYTAAVPEATTVIVWSLVGLCGLGLVRSRRLWA